MAEMTNKEFIDKAVENNEIGILRKDLDIGPALTRLTAADKEIAELKAENEHLDNVLQSTQHDYDTLKNMDVHKRIEGLEGIVAALIEVCAEFVPAKVMAKARDLAISQCSEASK